MSIFMNIHNLLLRLAFLILIFLSCSQTIFSQEIVNYVTIRNITIQGNNKTNDHVILREMSLHVGDTIYLTELASITKLDEQRILSIGLFTLADINIKNWDVEANTVDIAITVQENWYIYPYVIFELADRNFNVWRKEFNYSLSRINYGLALTHINFTGNKDKLKLKLQYGFTQKYEILYDYPYVSGAWGLSSNFLYTENREVAYKTDNNKLIFYKDKDERKLLHQYRFNIILKYRNNPLHFHSLKLEYYHFFVDPIVSADLNSNYLLNRRSRLQFLQFEYLYKYDKTIYPLYPQGGNRIELQVRKDGLGVLSGINNLFTALSIEHHTRILPTLVLSNRLKGRVHLLSNQAPFLLNSGLGYQNDFISGYQLYVMDGRNYLLSKNAIKWKMLDANFTLSEWMPKILKVMNTKIFLRFNFDYGYISDPYYGATNSYTNSHQYGYGPALDIILYNNLTISGQLSRTKDGESGFFFESTVNF